MKKKKEPLPPTRGETLGHLVGIIAGLEHQLGFSTHTEEAATRVETLIRQGPPQLDPEQIRELENLLLWIERTRRAAGAWRVKLEALNPPLYEEANRLRVIARGDYAPG